MGRVGTRAHVDRDVNALHDVTRGNGMEVHANNECWESVARNWEAHPSAVFGRRIVVTRFFRQGPDNPVEFPVTDRPVDGWGSDRVPANRRAARALNKERSDLPLRHWNLQRN